MYKKVILKMYSLFSNPLMRYIYINESSSIVSYDIFSNIKICEIKNKFLETISVINHYPDYYGQRDLIMTIQEMQRNLKIWNFLIFH